MPDHRILFFSEGIKFSLRNKAKVRKWLDDIARSHKRKIDALTYVFVSDKKLLEMNNQFLAHDTLTDIITFPLEATKGSIAGEIYISIDRVKENAKAYGEFRSRELARVMAHGLLHLCGFKDKSTRDQKVMRAQEEKALDLHTH